MASMNNSVILCKQKLVKSIELILDHRTSPWASPEPSVVSNKTPLALQEIILFTILSESHWAPCTYRWRHSSALKCLPHAESPFCQYALHFCNLGAPCEPKTLVNVVYMPTASAI